MNEYARKYKIIKKNFKFFFRLHRNRIIEMAACSISKIRHLRFGFVSLRLFFFIFFLFSAYNIFHGIVIKI